MSIPSRSITAPVIDLDALERTIVAQSEQLGDDVQIRSRSQALLDDAQKRVLELEGEKKAIRSSRIRLSDNIGKLNSMLEEMLVVENDIDVELSVQNNTVAMLKTAGVAL